MKEQKENVELEIFDNILSEESDFPYEEVETSFIRRNKFINFEHRLLTREEEYELIQKFQESEDKEEKLKVLEYLYKHNQKLIVSIILKYKNEGLSFDDLFQEGYLGFQTAIEKFDLSSGNKLSTYATFWIRQAVQRAIEDNGSTIRVPVHQQEKIRRLNKINTRLQQKLGREPSVEEIAKEMNLSTKIIKDLLNYSTNPISLNTPINDDNTTELQELLSSDSYNKLESKMLQDELRKKILDSLYKLCNTERELYIIIKRTGLDGKSPKTLEEIGKELCVTRERIRQIEERVLERLRNSPELKKVWEEYKPYIGTLNVTEENDYIDSTFQILHEPRKDYSKQNKQEEKNMKTLLQLLNCTRKELTFIKKSLTEEELILLEKSFGKKLKNYQNNGKISLHEKEVLYKTILPRLEQKILENRENKPIETKEIREMKQIKEQDKNSSSDINTKKQKVIEKNTILSQETSNIKEVNTQNKNYRVKDRSQYNKTPRNKYKYNETTKKNNETIKKNNETIKKNNKQYKKDDNLNDLVSSLSKEILTDVINNLTDKEKVIGLLTYGYVDDRTYTTGSIAHLFNEPREEIEKTQEMIIDKYVEKLTELTDSIISEESSKVEYKTVKMKTNK